MQKTARRLFFTDIAAVHLQRDIASSHQSDREALDFNRAGHKGVLLTSVGTVVVIVGIKEEGSCDALWEVITENTDLTHCDGLDLMPTIH
jgi:hypothetical protein